MNTTTLNPCHHCNAVAQVVPAVKRGLFIAECSNRIDCDQWPMTDPKTSEEEAAAAWQRGEFAQVDKPSLADAE